MWYTMRTSVTESNINSVLMVKREPSFQAQWCFFNIVWTPTELHGTENKIYQVIGYWISDSKTNPDITTSIL